VVVAMAAIVHPATPELLEKDLAASLGEIEDDGTVELALMATEHPVIKHFGSVIFEHMRTTNALLRTCAPWFQQAGELPEAALTTHRTAQATAGAVQKEIECLDNIDFSLLEPGWGDKATVRMARKSLIGFAELIMERLDDVQARLAEPAAKLREQKAKRAAAESAAAEHMASVQEKAHNLRKTEHGRDRCVHVTDEILPPKRPKTGIAAADVEELLQKLEARVNRPVQKRAVQAFARQLMNFSALTDLPKSPPLCRDGVECALGAVRAVLEAPSGPPPQEVLSKLLSALKQIETLQDPAGLPVVLLDLANVVQAI